MSNALNKVVQVSLSGIDHFLSTYSQQLNAFSFIYEDDLKAELYNAIKVALDTEGLLHAKAGWIVCEKHNTISDSIQLVHCEQAFQKSQVDIVVWDPTAEENCKKDYKKKLCSLLLEVKQNCRCKDLLRRVRRDIKKIEDWRLSSEQIALALGFCTEPVSVANSLLKSSSLGGPLAGYLTPGTRHATIVCADGWLHV
jgi:hypothetical protein